MNVVELERATLKLRRHRMSENVRKCLDLANRMKQDPSLSDQFMVRASKLTDSLTEFGTLVEQCYKLELTMDANATEQPFSEMIEAYEEIYFEVMEAYDSHKTSPNASTSAIPLNTTMQQLSVKLPEIDLQKFDGTLTDWPEFKDNFEAMVGGNDHLKSSAKLVYLKRCLSGPALALVKELSSTTLNYEVAWVALKERYDNERMLGAELVSKLLNFQPIKKESEAELSRFLSVFGECYAALGQLAIVQLDNFIIMHAALKSLPIGLQKAFERTVDKKTIPSLSDLTNFVQSQLRILNLVSTGPTANGSSTSTSSANRALVTASEEPRRKIREGKYKDGSRKRTNVETESKYQNSQSRPSKNNNVTKTSTEKRNHPTKTKEVACSSCGQAHRLMDCPTYTGKTTAQRRELIQLLKLCFNCLGRNHVAEECLSKYRCTQCKKKHHSTIHDSKDSKEINANESSTINAVHCTTPSMEPTSCNPKPSTIMLATALIAVKTHRGKMTVRALLDSAAQGTFLTTRCARRLRLRVEEPNHSVSGLAKNPVPIRNKVKVDLSSRRHQLIARQHTVEILDEITGPMPTSNVSPEIRAKLQGLPLADPQFDSPGPIDLLIGADLYGNLFTGEKRSLGEGMPTALATVMGFVVLGSAPVDPKLDTTTRTALITTRDQALYDALQRFWQLEEPQPKVLKPAEEDPAEVHFRNTTTISSEERFKVRLPFKESPDTLGDTKPQALRRFRALEERFRKQPELKDEYVKLMEEHMKEGIVKPSKPEVTQRPHFFLPHHGVLKPSSTTSRLRIVFDASAKTSSGVSLNDVLHVGPQLLCDIRDVLLRFRFHRFILVCDIRRMYLQIQLDEEDQPFHLFLWRTSETEPIQTYQLTTVTFGVGPSAFQSQRCLRQLSSDHGGEFPLAAEAIEEDTYVDNITTGGPTISLATQRKSQLIQLLAKRKFVLRKWISNVPELLEGLPNDHLETPVTWEDQQTSAFPIMGLQWIPKDDAFSYAVKTTPKPPTKRGIVSMCASIFDPCGWITPVVFWAKRFIQELWIKGVDWDTELTTEVMDQWNNFLNDLPSLSRIRLPRFLEDPGTTVQIHAFGDASEKGFAAVVYMRTEKRDGSCKVDLVTAKSKVAPLKRVTIPRLELCAAVLVTALLKATTKELERKYEISKVAAWSDSTTVLQWLRTPSYKLQVFVANRVEYVQETLPEVQWQYTNSETNPADAASRGLTASEISNHDMWWQGPPWLRMTQSSWPVQPENLSNTQLPELKHVHLITHSFDAVQNLFDRYSDWSKLQRILAYVFRHLHNRLHPKNQRRGSLSSTDFEEAERLIVRKIQYSEFSEDIGSLNKGQVSSSRLRKLTPFIDQHGLIRVGGRLAYSCLSETRKHPWILPPKHPLVASLIREWHVRYLHAGAQQLQSLISDKFWILAGRGVIRSTINKCIPCFKVKPRAPAPLMGNLPLPRVKPSRPFLNTGTDYAGPYRVKVHTLRFAKIVPAYICIFVCMSTKAANIEVTEDMTATAFLAALSRMAARRGAPKNIYSDCGSNLVGASNELKRVMVRLNKELKLSSEITKYTQEHGITFHFNPPAAPHHGGLWEAAVKSYKKHVSRVMQNEVLTIEEFRTVTVRTEAMLNSRPLVPMSSDPTDLRALTPAHFLIGEPITIVPEDEHPEDKLPLKRWHRVQAMSQAIWRRWKQEYLQTLTKKGKWDKDSGSLALHELVLIHEPGKPSIKWQTGRVSAVHPDCSNMASNEPKSLVGYSEDSDSDSSSESSDGSVERRLLASNTSLSSLAPSPPKDPVGSADVTVKWNPFETKHSRRPPVTNTRPTDSPQEFDAPAHTPAPPPKPKKIIRKPVTIELEPQRQVIILDQPPDIKTASNRKIKQNPAVVKGSKPTTIQRSNESKCAPKRLKPEARSLLGGLKPPSKTNDQKSTKPRGKKRPGITPLAALRNKVEYMFTQTTQTLPSNPTTAHSATAADVIVIDDQAPQQCDDESLPNPSNAILQIAGEGIDPRRLRPTPWVVQVPLFYYKWKAEGENPEVATLHKEPKQDPTSPLFVDRSSTHVPMGAAHGSGRQSILSKVFVNHSPESSAQSRSPEPAPKRRLPERAPTLSRSSPRTRHHSPARSRHSPDRSVRYQLPRHNDAHFERRWLQNKDAKEMDRSARRAREFYATKDRRRIYEDY